MSYEKIAEGQTGTLVLEIFEKDAAPQSAEPIIITNIVEKKGTNSPEKYKAHLPFEMQFSIVDMDRYFLDKFRNSPMDRFKAVITDGGSDYAELYFNTRFQNQNYYSINTERELSAHDGITLLKTKDIVTGTKQIGLLIEELIHLTGIEYDVIITTDIDTALATGQNGVVPNQWRVKEAEAFVREVDSPKAYDQLMAILEHYKFQLFQENGTWRVMEREARRGATINIYNITQDTASTTDPRVTIAGSDVLKETDDNYMDQVSSITRSMDNGASDYEYKNGEFFSWSGDDLLHWVIEDAAAFQKYEDSNETGIEIISNSQLIMQNLPLYSLKFRDMLRFRFSMSFDWESGLPPGQNWEVEVARILLLGHSGTTTFGFNQTTGEFDPASDGIISRAIDTDSYTISEIIGFNTDVEIPSLGRLLVEIFFRGDTGLVATDPILLRADWSEVLVSDSLTVMIFTSHTAKPGSSIEETVRVTEPSRTGQPQVIAYSDLEVWDGTEWIDSGNLTSFWGDFSKISELVVNKMAESSVNSDHLVKLHLSHQFDIEMMNTVAYEVNGTERNYVPHFIQYNRKEKQRRVMLIETKSDSVTAPEVSYE